MNPVSLQPAYILHHRQFRDTSLIVDLLTPEHGRVSAVARGARSAKSRRRPLLQPFRPLLVSWTGRSELRTLTSVEESGMPLPLQGLPLSCAYYASELALRLVSEGTANGVVFAHYVQALAQLVENPDIEMCLRQFELDLLEALGLLPDLSHCERDSVAIVAGGSYVYDIQGSRATRVEPGPEGLQSGERGIAVSGKTLLSMHLRDFSDDQVRREAKHLMRNLIAAQLGGQPLKSRALFEKKTAKVNKPDGQ